MTFKINAKADDNHAEILIYGEIGESWFGESVEAKAFVKEIGAITAKNITVRINSIGGSVPDGLAIFNAIDRHPATVTTVNDGQACSIAGLIMQAGDVRDMAANAQYMIHGASTGLWGMAEDHRDCADLLDAWSESMAVSIAARSGRPKEDVAAELKVKKDYWFNADEALEAGYIDNITGALAIAASHTKEDSQKQLNALFGGIGAKAPATPTPVAAAAKPTGEPPMPKGQGTENGGTNPADVKAIEANAAKAALDADKARRTEIRAAFEPFATHNGMDDLMATCLDDHTITAAAAGQKILAKLAEGTTPIQAGRNVVTVEDRKDKVKAGVSNALLARAGMGDREGNNEFNSFSLPEMARACLDVAGITAYGDRYAMISAAITHTSSDFPIILSNIAEKAMLKGVEEAEETFPLFTSKGVLNDFKAAGRIDMDQMPSLRKVNEGAEYKYVTLGESQEMVMLATYGEKFAITRQGIINDDMDMFTRIPMKFGRAAYRTVGDLVFAILKDNPKMRDNKALFHNDHKNILAGSGIDSDAVDAMRTRMRTQKSGVKNQVTSNIRLAHLLVPAALEGQANVVRESQNHVGTSSDHTIPNKVRNTFDVISDGRLDDVSATEWYGLASAGTHDVIEVDYLNGNELPTLEQKGGWDVDGVEFKVRIDAAAKALSWITMAKNPGA